MSNINAPICKRWRRHRASRRSRRSGSVDLQAVSVTVWVIVKALCPLAKSTTCTDSLCACVIGVARPLLAAQVAHVEHVDRQRYVLFYKHAQYNTQSFRQVDSCLWCIRNAFRPSFFSSCDLQFSSWEEDPHVTSGNSVHSTCALCQTCLCHGIEFFLDNGPYQHIQCVCVCVWCKEGAL